MQHEQHNRLIEHPQPSGPSSNTSKIHNVRVKKELEYLANYTYTLGESNGSTSIVISNLWGRDSLGEEEFVENIIGTELEIILSKDYPFKQPTFIHNRTEQLSIAELIDEWSPRFKILQMIQLIRKRIEQRNALNFKMGDNFIYHAFKAVDSLWVWLLLVVIVKACVGFGSYSGKADWPNLGDFEAHRNWMSVTVHRPIQKWYTEHSSEPWWRIDYPPVAAYVSWLLGSIYNKIQPQSLLVQEGYESANLIAFMRATVILVDCLFLMPAIYLVAQECSPLKYRNKYLFNASIFIMLIKPDLILIDHGHFQYNCLMLGLILYAFYFMITGRRYLCCFVYTLAINAKLMSVYFSLAFLAGLVGITARKLGRSRREKIIGECIYYAIIVTVTTLLLWLPWLGSGQSFSSVLHAIFPIHRGLYQLKVPNFWCISDVVMKWQSWLSKPVLTILCFALCLGFSLPSMAALLLKPTSRVLVIGFSCISMTFFMFSYHVHEKSILVPLAIIPFVSQYLGGTIVIDLVVGGCAGMFHLLVEDGQTLSYFVLVLAYVMLANAYYYCEDAFIQIYHPHSNSYYHAPAKSLQPIETSTAAEQFHHKHFGYGSKLHLLLVYGGLAALHLGQFLIAPPQSLPYLWHLLFAFYSFVFNVYFVGLCNWVLYEEVKGSLLVGKRE